MIKKATQIIFFVLIALSLSACQKTQVKQLSCPTAKIEKKIIKSRFFNANKDLERLLARTKDLSRYEMKTETKL